MRSDHTLGSSGRRVAFLVAALAMALAGCFVAADGEPPPGVGELDIGSTDGCFTEVADQVADGSVSLVSGTAYGHTACPSAFLVDLNHYARSQNGGLWAAYNGARPTTQTVCEATTITAFVWKRGSGSSKTYLGAAEQRGVWYPGGAGGGFCEIAAVHVESKIAALAANDSSSYRVALLARQGDIFFTTNALSLRSTEKRSLTALGVADQMKSFADTLGTLAAGTTHVFVDALWSLRGTEAIRGMCRSHDVTRIIQSFGTMSLVKAGAPLQALNDRNTANARLSASICAANGTKANFQTGLRDLSRATNAIIDGIKGELDRRISNASAANRQLAAAMLFEITSVDIGTLFKQCNFDLEPVLAYIANGTLPAGQAVAEMVLAECSPSNIDPDSIEDLSAVASGLDIGSLFGGQTMTTARDDFANCMMPLVNGIRQDVCNDPRASGDEAPDDPAQEPDEEPDSTESCAAAGLVFYNGACTFDNPVDRSGEALDPELEARLVDLEEQNQRLEGMLLRQQAQMEEQQQFANQAELASAHDRVRDEKIGVIFATGAFGLAIATAYVTTAPVSIPLTVAGLAAYAVSSAGLAAGTAILAGAATVYASWRLRDAQGKLREVQERNRPDCVLGSSTGDCNMDNKMCGPDLDVPAWYTTPGEDRQLDKVDHLDHCVCALMDRRYESFPGDPSSAMCPSREEKERHDCLTDPSGDDDRPVRFECAKYLRPGHLDARAWQLKICEAAKCPADQMPLLGDGGCDCIPKPEGDIMVALPCENGTMAYCLEEGNCGCGPLDSGTAPIGNDPLCRFRMDAAAWPGAIDNFPVIDPSDVYVTQFDSTNRFAMVRPGSILTSPTIYRNSLDAIPAVSSASPAKLRVKTLVPEAADGALDLEIRWTSLDLPAGTQALSSTLIGSAHLDAVPIGVPTNIDVPLSQGLINRAVSGERFMIEYTVKAPPDYGRFVGIGAQQFVGATTTIPLGNRAPECPATGGNVRPVLITNPLWIDAGGTLADFFVTTPLDAVIPQNISVLRDVTLVQ